MNPDLVHRLRVAVDTPQHAGLASALDYAFGQTLAPGTLVRVPLGRRDVPGLVWPSLKQDEGQPERPLAGLKTIAEVLSALPPLPSAWCDLVDFTARYYQRAVGEVALSVLPPELRKLDNAGLAKRLNLLAKRSGWPQSGTEAPQAKRPSKRQMQDLAHSTRSVTLPVLPALQVEQQQVLELLLL